MGSLNRKFHSTMWTYTNQFNQNKSKTLNGQYHTNKIKTLSLFLNWSLFVVYFLHDDPINIDVLTNSENTMKVQASKLLKL